MKLSVGTATEEHPAASGINGSSAVIPAARVPLRTRQRRPAQVALGVVLILGLGVLGGLAYESAGSKAPVVTVIREIPKGHVVTAADLSTVDVAGGVVAVAGDHLGSVLGETATVDLFAGHVVAAVDGDWRAEFGGWHGAGRGGGHWRPDPRGRPGLRGHRRGTRVAGEGRCLHRGRGCGDDVGAQGDGVLHPTGPFVRGGHVGHPDGAGRRGGRDRRRFGGQPGGFGAGGAVIVGVCSDKGSPGVTTLAVALGLVWPGEQCLVIECDPSGGVLSFRMQHAEVGGLLQPEPTVASLASVVRRGLSGDGLRRFCQPTTLGVPVIPGPLTAQRWVPVRGLWPQIAKELADWSGTVIADLGRMQPGNAALPVAQAASAVLLVGHADVEGLFGLRDRAGVVGACAGRPGQGTTVGGGGGHRRTGAAAKQR